MEEDIDRPMPYKLPMKGGNNDKLAGQVTKLIGGKGMMGIPAMPPQDTPPERIIGEPGPQDTPAANPMVSALKRAMSSRPNRGKNLGNLMGGFSAGGSVSSASKRGDGIAQKGKTRGKMC
jgi:hypothetical protein